MSREIADLCPWCGAKVEQLRGEGIRRDPKDAETPHTEWRYATYAQPCGHKVQATVWPDRVDLEKP